MLKNALLARLDVGDTIIIDAFLDNTCLNLQIKYLGKEKVKSKSAKGRKINALEFAPLMSAEGLPARETPVKIQVKLSAGSVALELKEFRRQNIKSQGVPSPGS